MKSFEFQRLGPATCSGRPVSRRRSSIISALLSVALGLGGMGLLPERAHAQLCPPEVTGFVQISSSVLSSGVCAIVGPLGAVSITSTGSLGNEGSLVNASHILLIEPVREDSQVAKLIEEQQRGR